MTTLTGALDPRMLPAIGIGSLLLLLGACVLLLRGASMQRRVRRRIDHARGAPVEERAITVDQVSALPMVALTAFGRLIANSGVLPTRTLQELEQTLAAAGFRGASGLWLFLGAKIALFGGLPLVAMVMTAGNGAAPMKRLAIAGVAAAGGLLAPDWIIGRMRKRYVARLEQGLPDALDLLVICAQAGLGLEAAIERVAEEIRPAHRDIGRELELTARELQIVADSRVALAALGQRTGLDSLKRLTGTLLQSLQYGTPLSSALRSLAAEMRQEALTRFEEKAARLPVLLTLPMVVFILPCVFIIVGGPAVLRILHAFGH